MRRLRVKQKANDLDTLDLSIEEVPSPPLTGSQVRVRVHAAGVNQSDVKATLGSMPKAVWPRTPGRDWAGVVEEGPAEWKGAEGLRHRRGSGHHAGWLLRHRVGAAGRCPDAQTVAACDGGGG